MKQLSVRQERSSEPLQVRLIETLEEFNRIEQEWQKLVVISNVDAVFMSHVWLSTWWESFKSNGRLYIITVYSGNDLIGAAPLMITDSRMYGIRVRKLESLYNCHTPRCDFLIADRHEEVYRTLWRTIGRMDDEWDLILLSQVPSDSPTLSNIKQLATKDGWITGEWTPRPSLYIDLRPGLEGVLNGLKGKARYNLRRRQSRLSEIDTVSLEIVRDPEQVLPALTEGLEIEAAAWKGENGTAMNSSANVREFYVKLAERTAQLDWLRLCFLKVGDKRIAFDYVIEKEGVLYGVKIGYDPEYHSHSPSHLLLLDILRDACDRNSIRYDFLGTDDEWKYMWTNQALDHQWLFLFPNTLRGGLLHRLKFRIGPWCKHALRRFPCIYPHGRA